MAIWPPLCLSFSGLYRVSWPSHVCADGCWAYVQRVAVSFRYPVRVLKHQLAVGKAKGAWEEGHDYGQGATFRRGLRGGGGLMRGGQEKPRKASLREGCWGCSERCLILMQILRKPFKTGRSTLTRGQCQNRRDHLC